MHHAYGGGPSYLFRRSSACSPWHITVIRTRGLLFVRPEKSWRPIVSLSIVDKGRDHGLPHEIVLGSDGQNPNLKSVIPIHDVSPATQLVIQIYHKSQTKKKHRKRTLVGSANLSLSEFLNKHPLPHHRPVEYDLRLACPPPQRKCSTVSGKQQHSAALTLKVAVPHTASPTASRPSSPLSEGHFETDGMLSDCASSSKYCSETLVASAMDESNGDAAQDGQIAPEKLSGPSSLRRRRRVRGFRVDSDSDGGASESSCEDPWAPPTPPDDYLGEYGDNDCGCDLFAGLAEEAEISPCVLPSNHGQVSVVSMRGSLSFAEAMVDSYAPYHELREADDENDVEKAEKVLGRLLTEWYVVGASLLALAGIDAAVFGFAPDATFSVEGFSRSVVAIGAIAAGIGLVSDAWFLVRYSGGNAVKFLRAAKDVYNSYFFFCLTCRLPTMCMFISTLALMFFLLSVAWTAWPTAVLVMSFVAGLLLSSQFLIFGVHRFVNLLVWVARVSWRRLHASRQTAEPQSQPPIQPSPPPQYEQHPTPASQSPRHSHAHDRIEMPVAVPTGEIAQG
ncbi:hypothetical protein C8Q78DRAFT_666780 [Trametes maxima]|nr:hypothetical protein C8Q78DRAFT_666780 [Trametes maxima]